MTGRCRLCGEDFYNLLLLVRSNPWSRNLTGGECALSILSWKVKSFQQECKVVALTTHSSGADMTGDRWLAVPERDSQGYGQFHEYWLHDSTFPSDSTSYCTGVKCGFWDRGLESKCWLPHCLAAWPWAGHLSLCASVPIWASVRMRWDRLCLRNWKVIALSGITVCQ